MMNKLLRIIARIIALSAVVLLVGCSTTDKSGRDGPPDDDRFLGTIYDAIPRDEPIREANSRPYTIRGKHYVPLTTAVGYKKTGVASWYGTKFHGRKTATGEVYDMWAMTAAHRTLPLPSYVRVRNLQNGRAITVRVNDRGPFIGDRIIDLSYAAAKKLNIVESGTGTVTVEGIDAKVGVPTDDENTALDALQTSQDNTFLFGDASNQWRETGSGVVGEIGSKQHYLIQVGSYTDAQNARAMRAKLRGLNYQLYPHDDAKQYAKRPYRVRVGPYLSRQLAQKIKAMLQQRLGVKPIIVRLNAK